MGRSDLNKFWPGGNKQVNQQVLRQVCFKYQHLYYQQQMFISRFRMCHPRCIFLTTASPCSNVMSFLFDWAGHIVACPLELLQTDICVHEVGVTEGWVAFHSTELKNIALETWDSPILTSAFKKNPRWVPMPDVQNIPSVVLWHVRKASYNRL